MRLVELAGRDYLDAVTRLLQRRRLDDPTGGVWEAADFQWWWRRVRPSDELGQSFWLDDADEPVAAVTLNDWDGAWECDVIVDPGDFEAVWKRALERIDELGLESVSVRARDDDLLLLGALRNAGFVPAGDEDTTTWLDAARRPPVAPLPEGFRLRSRAETGDRPHHMIRRNGEHVAERLASCSLYDPELDLLIEAPNGDCAGYAMFWVDPVTRVGLVEPMRTEDEYQRRGLARHLLTAGIDGLAARGCERMKVSYLSENAAAKALYLGVGFVPADSSREYRRGGA
jgi:ribosomal protein S18 acetylase RimI-like enzyme